MASIIESTYEIIEQLGSGGGGNVYLAKHRRLNKEVVLKIDKRKLSTRPEILRREVDVLKNLRHAYIPQVYDFFVENDQIVTVMDYIKGESLDRPLKRGETFPQAQVISWAKQMLEALAYLHSPIHGDPPKGYVHSDIKPANIMRLPNNDICLIDFNITLAIGEYNFIGRSLGYASPEHYGIDYSGKHYADETITDNNVTDSIGSDETATVDTTETMESDETETVSAVSRSTGGSTTGSGKKVLPDVRSDIYSLGATLYHLLCGVRPDRDAKKVVPLSADRFSKPVVEIITKAMAPNPDLRFQTANEMLEAFENLRKKDPRYKRLKRSKRIAVSVFSVLLVCGLFSTFVGLKRIQNKESALKNAEYSQSALLNGDVRGAISYALEGLQEKNLFFNPKYLAEPQKALTSALGVYDLSDSFKKAGTVALPSAPLYVRLSADGKTGACICSEKLIVFSAESGDVIAELDADRSAMSEVEFSDNDHIIYSGNNGITCYCISEKAVKWTGEPATSIAVAKNGKTAAAIYRDSGYAMLYDVSDGTVKGKLDFGGKHQFADENDIYPNRKRNLLEMDPEGKYTVIGFDDGSLNLYELDSNRGFVLFGASDYKYFTGAFCDGFLAICAIGSDSEYIEYDLETGEPVRTASTSSGTYEVETDGNAFLIFSKQNKIIGRVLPSPTETENFNVYSSNDAEASFAVSKDHVMISNKGHIIFNDMNGTQINSVEENTYNRVLDISSGTAVYGNADEPVLKIYRYDTCTDNEVLSYDPNYVHSETRISADRKYIMQFMFTQFRILDLNGNVVFETEIPDSEQVFDQQYLRENGASYLMVRYSDGRKVYYDGKDGAIAKEEKSDVPGKDLISDFSTDAYNIISPLHGNAEVYDKKTGKKIKEIVKDGYMTYVIQAGEYIIIQYRRDDGSYYAHLTDDKLNTVAELPCFTDFLEGELYFDYPSGQIRSSKIIGIEELIEKARSI